jgi:seryl-tRNA synthetase
LRGARTKVGVIAPLFFYFLYFSYILNKFKHKRKEVKNMAKEQNPPKEYKLIQEKLSELRKQIAANRQELRDLKKYKQKLFGDIALGLADAKEKSKTKKRIKELEEEFEDLRVTIKELEVRERMYQFGLEPHAWGYPE